MLAVIPCRSMPIPASRIRCPGYRCAVGAVFASESWRHAAWNSLVIAISTMIVSLALGIPAAIGLNRSNFRWKPILIGF